MTHQHLIRDIWGNHAGNIQYLRILVRKLRQKVELDPTRPRLIVSDRASAIGSIRAGRRVGRAKRCFV